MNETRRAGSMTGKTSVAGRKHQLNMTDSAMVVHPNLSRFSVVAGRGSRTRRSLH
ncbi:hypothetical protein ACVWZV_008523 [Bradyrhizobium sp. GM5.1]